MSPDAESHVSGSQGPVNTGTRHQFIGCTVYFDRSHELFVRVGRDPRAVAHEYLHWLHQRFVEPAHYGRARELLADNGSVLLTGPPGSGRRSAALMLLHRLSGADGQIRELPDVFDTSDSSDDPMLDGSAVDAGQRLLLDLSTSDEDYGRVLGELPLYRNVVRERGAHLVVVLPTSRTHRSGAELGPPAVEIGRPDGTDVFRRYLHSDRIPFTRDQLGADELATQLRSAPMQDIAELAALVHFSRESGHKQEFPDWLREALKALTEWSDEIAEQMQKLASGQQRALLLTTAMFSGAPADAVFAATSTLLEVIGQPEVDLPLLERKGFREQLAEIDATVDDDGRVGFARLAYDRAVRTYFWTNRPDLRAGFRDWVEAAIRQPTLTRQDREAVVTSFAEQALRTDRPGDLKCLAERWASTLQSSLLLQAAKTLEYGLGDERHGRSFRHLLYTWSTARTLSPNLARVVVHVCSEVLALAYPDQAMVRLHHIFRRQSGEAGAAARDALLDLVNRDRRLYSRLLDRATRDRATRDPRDVVADTALFLKLAHPARLTNAQQQTPPLIADVTVRAQLVSGWKTVLAAPSAPRADHVRDWLAACADDRFRDRLLDVLVDACDGRDEVLSRLYVIARDWAYTPDERQTERSEIAALLTNKINAAQGIDFTDPDLGHRTEETAT